MLRLLCTVTTLFFFTATIFAQTFGPNSPASQQSVGPGTNWTNNTGILNSDDLYSTANGEGDTRILRSFDYGFAIPPTQNIVGIELDVERKSQLGDDITILNGWQEGDFSQVQNYNLIASDHRLLVVFVGSENGIGEPVVSDVTYSGQSMTRLDGLTLFTSFWGAMECWYMLEDQLTSIPNGAHDIQVSYDPFIASEFFDIVSVVLLDNVDQVAPFNSTETAIYNGGPNTCQFNAPLQAGLGGAYLTGIFCGSLPSGASVGSSNNWLIDDGFSEGTDVYQANPSFIFSGGSMQTAFKLEPLGGLADPTFSLNGSPNRRLLFGLGLRKATAIDNTVQLRVGGTLVGNNYANTLVQWPIIDTYTTYGGPADLWGNIWTLADVNSAQFGGVLGVTVLNGSVDVDHMQITIYTENILPVELIDLQAKRISERSVNCEWYTATEFNTSHFVVERSADGVNFEIIGIEPAVGNSQSLLSYNYRDDNAPQNELYYRLKMVDFDGQFEYSDIRSVSNADDNMSVYPNPTSNWINILYPKKTGTITIASSSGRIIDQAEGAAFNSNYKYNLSSEPDGVYYVIVNSEDGQEVKRLTKVSK